MITKAWTKRLAQMFSVADGLQELWRCVLRTTLDATLPTVKVVSKTFFNTKLIPICPPHYGAYGSFVCQFPLEIQHISRDAENICKVPSSGNSLRYALKYSKVRAVLLVLAATNDRKQSAAFSFVRTDNR